MNTWNVGTLDLRPSAPEILTTTDDARAIALEIPAGGELKDHQVHERAWVIVVAGEVQFTTTAGETMSGGPGLMVEFQPGERHAVRASSTARLILLLTPWPGSGHPGTLTPEERANARQRAGEKAGQR